MAAVTVAKELVILVLETLEKATTMGKVMQAEVRQVVKVTATLVTAILVMVMVTEMAMADHPLGPEEDPTVPVVQLQEVAPVQIQADLAPVPDRVMVLLVVDLAEMDPVHLVAVLLLVMVGVAMVVMVVIPCAMDVLIGRSIADTIQKNPFED